ncbi:MAG: hypothetical protein HZT40_10585 [Candidatus Thiothrix singaporensis]|uniref:Uncharacterized protein n=1 Tax=Candidatus Thiothrix singaporensis TaxID=2799669 RepID=A0A7L6ASD1_9GAMM|nr:MAG: hypothetical protein HZT40_10585 [Candidatus Thiothrix singaporensis]
MHTNPYRSPESDVSQSSDAGYDSGLEQAASGQKMLIFAFIALVLGQILLAFSPSESIQLVVAIAVFVTHFLFPIGMYRLSSGLGAPMVVRIVLMILMLVPLLNLLVMLVASAKVNRVLREAGVEVGLLGAKT